MNPSNKPRILTTTVGSYPVPDWLAALPSEQALLDATRVVFDLQRQAGIDLPTDGELYRFDVNHPDTNGMIEYFVHKFGGVRRNSPDFYAACRSNLHAIFSRAALMLMRHCVGRCNSCNSPGSMNANTASESRFLCP